MNRAHDQHQPIAYFNGEFVPESDARLSVTDLGVVQGVTLTERVRTYGGRLFALDGHLSRFAHSAEQLGIEIIEQRDLPALVEQVVERNLPRQDVDLAVVFVATPGPRGGRPTLCLHAVEQPRPEWAIGYREGWTLQTTSVPAIPDSVMPRDVKHRSRLHWYLASRQLLATGGPCEPLLIDGDGVVTESAYGNVVLVQGGRLIAVERGRALPGVTENYVLRLAAEIGLEVSRRAFTLAELVASEEVLLTSTGYTVAPVVRVNSDVIGSGQPGGVWQGLSEAISNRVGIDFVEQAMQVFGRNQELA